MLLGRFYGRGGGQQRWGLRLSTELFITVYVLPGNIRTDQIRWLPVSNTSPILFIPSEQRDFREKINDKVTVTTWNGRVTTYTVKELGG